MKEYNCEICSKKITFPDKKAIRSGESKRFYYFKKYRDIKKRIMKIATYCSNKCYKEAKW